MNTVHYIMPGEGSDRNDPDYTAMFRDAESAALGPLKQTPPPSYQVKQTILTAYFCLKH